MSEFWKRKIKTFFHSLDFEKKGVITKADFKLMPELFSQRENTSPSFRDKTMKAYDDAWLKYTLAAVPEPEDKRVLTESVLIESLKKQRDDPELKKTIEEMVRSVYFMMDVNHDGYVTYDEYRRAFEHYGITEADFTKPAFDAIDLDKDGSATVDEFIIAFNDYLFSDDENSPNNLMWGPLL